jgi:hypothetical protein
VVATRDWPATLVSNRCHRLMTIAEDSVLSAPPDSVPRPLRMWRVSTTG